MPDPSVSQGGAPYGRCPECSTELTRCVGHRGRPYIWCWKCERAMRPGERRKAMGSVGSGEHTPRGER